MSLPDSETRTPGPPPKLLFAPTDGKAYTPEDRRIVFSQQPLESQRLPRYLIPSPASRMKPPELKYGWRLGEQTFMSLIRTHFEDAIHYSLGPELDDDGNEPDLPPEEFHRLYPDTHSTLFGISIVDSILKYLDAPITDANRQLIDVDYLRDCQGRPDVGLSVGSTYTGKMLLEPYYCKLKALVSPNEDAKWYLGYKHWQWRRQVPEKVSRPKEKKAVATAVNRPTPVS